MTKSSAMGHRPLDPRRLNEFHFSLRLGIHLKKSCLYYSFTTRYPLDCTAYVAESTEPSSFLEADSFSTGQELRILRSSKVPNLSQINTFRVLPYQL